MNKLPIGIGSVIAATLLIFGGSYLLAYHVLYFENKQYWIGANSYGEVVWRNTTVGTEIPIIGGAIGWIAKCFHNQDDEWVRYEFQDSPEWVETYRSKVRLKYDLNEIQMYAKPSWKGKPLAIYKDDVYIDILVLENGMWVWKN